MKQTKQFLRPLLMAIVLLVGMLVPQGAKAQIILIPEWGDQIWCESIYVALNTLKNESGSLGDGPVIMRFDEDISFSETISFDDKICQDLTIDLDGHVLTNESWAADWMSAIIDLRIQEYSITIKNGTIESNEIDAIYFRSYSSNNSQLILENVNVVTHQEGRHCLFDAKPEDWDDLWDWGYVGDTERAPYLQIIDSQFHSNGCSAISFTRQRNDERVKSILPGGYSFYNANTKKELVEYADRPFVDENGNPATDIRTGRSQDLPKVEYNDTGGYFGNFKQAMDCNNGEFTLTLHDDVKEGLCTTNRFKSVTIDLNGHTLDITRLYANGDYLNIIDSSEGKTGRLIVERFDVDGQTENNAVIEGEIISPWQNEFTNNGLVEYVDGIFINNGDFITSWTWADDHSSATLRINHADVDAVVTDEDTTPATCVASGVRTYTAAATYRDKNYADTKDEEIAIDPNAHDYHVQLDENSNPVFVWSEGYTTATLQVVCSHNAEHTANVEVTGEGITSEDTTPATCTAAGVRTYTATATYEGEEYTGTKEVEIPALGHQFGEDHICTVCHQPAAIAHTGTSGTCTWTIYEDGHMIFEPTTGETGTLGEWNWDSSPWFAYRSEIKSVKFQGEVIASTCWYMFYDCSNLTTIDFSGFNTANVRDMAHMFQSCTSLQSLDLSSFNTANVQSLASMFESCQNLATLKLSNDFVLNEGVNKTDLFDNCGTEADQLSIYYVIDESIKVALLYETDLFELEASGKVNFVPSAIVKDGVSFNVTLEWAWTWEDIPAENIVFTRTFTAEKPASVMLPFTVKASQISGATFYEFKGVKYENNEWVADMTEVTTVREYTPYVVITSGTGITFTGDNIYFPSTEDGIGNMTQTDAETGWTFVALNEFKRWEADDEEIGKAYGFAGKNKDYDDYSVAKGEFVKIAAGASAKPGRCYLVKNDGEPLAAKGMTRASAADELPSTIKVRFISGSANGIGTLNTETGEMTLEGWYDLHGNKIEQPSKGGVYINNNKKVMVK